MITNSYSASCYIENNDGEYHIKCDMGTDKGDFHSQYDGKDFVFGDLEYALYNLLELGIGQVYIVVGKEGDLIKNILGNHYKELEIFYVVQQEQKGLIDAFYQAINIIGYDSPVVLQLSDEVFIDFKADEIKKLLKADLYDFYCGITYEDNPDKIKNNFSVKSDDNGLIKECIEKPVEIINNIKGTGCCIFNSESLQILKDKNADEESLIYDLCDYINYLVKNDKKGLALHLAEKEFNVNTFADLLEVQIYLDAD